jgi:hypothetical protein
MDLRKKFVSPKFLYFYGKFQSDSILKIDQNGKIEALLSRSELPASADVVELKNEVSLFFFDRLKFINLGCGSRICQCSLTRVS